MTFRALNPATGDVLTTRDLHTAEEVERRLATAQEAFTAYRRTSFDDRSRRLRRLATLLRDRAGELGELMTAEMGKPIEQARGEARKCAWVCDYFADQGAHFLAPEPLREEDLNARVDFQPLGPILAIMPWNFPLWQVFRFAVPTLMAGNTALLKHAPNVPGCSAIIADLFEEAGFADGEFQELLIDVDATADVIADRRIRGVALTGSTAAGRAVAAQAGQHLKPCVLELGGSDPFIVLDGCDLDHTVDQAVFARMMNNGQSCIAAKRFLVEEPIYDRFLSALKKAIESLTVGDPTDEATDVGPMAREDLRDELHRQVRESIDAGARLLVGGEPLDRPGFFYAPTLLTGVAPGMPAFDEEIFGPAAAVTRVADAAEAVALANHTDYGLGASVWGPPEAAASLARELQAGAVAINESVKSDPRLPFGGIKDSGFGRELSAFGIREFVNIKSVVQA